MNKRCHHCSIEYTITDQDQQFYKSFDVAAPALCLDCRRTRRLCAACYHQAVY